MMFLSVRVTPRSSIPSFRTASATSRLHHPFVRYNQSCTTAAGPYLPAGGTTDQVHRGDEARSVNKPSGTLTTNGCPSGVLILSLLYDTRAPIFQSLPSIHNNDERGSTNTSVETVGDVPVLKTPVGYSCSGRSAASQKLRVASSLPPANVTPFRAPACSSSQSSAKKSKLSPPGSGRVGFQGTAKLPHLIICSPATGSTRRDTCWSSSSADLSLSRNHRSSRLLLRSHRWRSFPWRSGSRPTSERSVSFVRYILRILDFSFFASFIFRFGVKCYDNERPGAPGAEPVAVVWKHVRGSNCKRNNFAC